MMGTRLSPPFVVRSGYNSVGTIAAARTARREVYMKLLKPARSKHLLPVAVLVIGLLAIATACGAGDGGSANGGGIETTGPAGGAISHPTGANELVLQVITGGGFVPIEYHLTLLPTFSLYGDGTVIVPGPTIMIYPGPALPNLQTTKLSEQAIQEILSAAKEAGLFRNDFDYGSPRVADVPTTTITISAGGQVYRSSIYALGFEDAGNLTLEQQQARAAVKPFQAKLETLAFADQEPTWNPYQFTGLAVFVRQMDPASSPDPTDVQPNRLSWPLGDLATAGGEEVLPGHRRLVISGADLETLRPLLDQATQITIWESGGKEYSLAFRPLLPDESQ